MKSKKSVVRVKRGQPITNCHQVEHNMHKSQNIISTRTLHEQRAQHTNDVLFEKLNYDHQTFTLNLPSNLLLYTS